MSHATAQRAGKHGNNTVTASKPVAINHASTVRNILQAKLTIGPANDN